MGLHVEQQDERISQQPLWGEHANTPRGPSSCWKHSVPKFWSS